MRTDPVITSVSPASGSPVLARDVTISGANFGLNANVTLNGVRVSHVVSAHALCMCTLFLFIPSAPLPSRAFAVLHLRAASACWFRTLISLSLDCVSCVSCAQCAQSHTRLCVSVPAGSGVQLLQVKIHSQQRCGSLLSSLCSLRLGSVWIGVPCPLPAVFKLSPELIASQPCLP